MVDEWRHEPSGVVFLRIPGGTFRMGLSDEELDALRGIAEREEADEDLDWLLDDVEWMRPVRTVTVAPFWLARHPLTVAQVRHWLPEYSDDYGSTPDAAARLEHELDDLLSALPFRLPSEAEWEYAARAGTTTLTYRGDAVPPESWLLDRFGDEALVRASENPFGLAAMGSLGELCADAYTRNYTDAPADARPRPGDGPRVVRGGAADVSPWQGCNEWLGLLSAARQAQDMFAAVRPALDAPL